MMFNSEYSFFSLIIFVRMYISHGKPSQKWRYISHTRELRTFQDLKCLDWRNGVLTMKACDASLNQQFAVPAQWLAEGIDTNTFDKLLVKSDPGKCWSSLSGTNKISFKECYDGDAHQEFAYDPHTRQIKHNFKNKCVDYNTNNQEVTLFQCNNGNNQKWFYDMSSKQVRVFHDNKCLDWNDVDAKLRMWTCHSGENQKFVIPPKWLLDMSSSNFEEVRIMANPYKCMEANPNNENIYMVNCQPGNLNQVFHYDRQTRTIRRDGRCLDQNIESNNVYMHFDCHGGTNQQWYFEENLIKNLQDDRCLDMHELNLYMQADCHGQDNQKFIVPSLWLPDIYMDSVRIFQDRAKCMDAHPDNKNNVYMADCEAGNSNQVFYFDSR